MPSAPKLVLPPRENLHLVPRQIPRRTPLALWHLLSLDAPTVATVWTVFIARATHTKLSWTSPAAMFVAVWLLYAADRLLDARGPSSELEERHHFHNRHRRAFLTAATFAAVTLTALLHTLPAATLRLDTLLASLLAAWLLLIHARALPAPHRLPKELAVGLFFPAAVFIPTVAQHPELRPELVPATALFAAICTLNCLFVYAWEHPRNQTQAHWTTRWAMNRLRSLCMFTVVASTAYAAAAHSSFLAIATALSALLLLLLHGVRSHLSRIHLRALADAALLTPLLLLPFTR